MGVTIQTITGGGGGSSIPDPGIATNRYYFGGIFYGDNSSASVAANTLYALPFIVTGTETFTRIGVSVETGAAGNARLGIYNFADGVPTTLVLDAGTVSTTTSGDKEITISQSLTAGTYVLASVFDATPSMMVPVANDFAAITNFMGSSTIQVNEYFIYSSFSYAALPSPFGTPAYDGAVLPLMWLRKV